MSQKPTPPTDPGSEPSQPDPDATEFEQAFFEIERTLQALRERYTQVRRDQQRQVELHQRQRQINQELRQSDHRQSLRAELQQIRKELETIELNLESQLFSWASLKEPFWQAVRFGGLGIVVGWVLKSCAS